MWLGRGGIAGTWGSLSFVTRSGLQLLRSMSQLGTATQCTATQEAKPLSASLAGQCPQLLEPWGECRELQALAQGSLSGSAPRRQ